ncbi:hypothetical protein AX16_007907 [Volvariella volvacea WC 439]|nr:hypothetical protein AX16_007907 [Volvariella volvacea WC 439]
MSEETDALAAAATTTITAQASTARTRIEAASKLHQQPRAQVAAFLRTPYPDDLISRVGGNAPRAIKEIPMKWLGLFHARKQSFARSVAVRMEVTEVWVNAYDLGAAKPVVVDGVDEEMLMVGRKAEVGGAMEGKVVVELDVTQDMINGRTGMLSEGCIVFLIDECTAIAAAVLNAVEGKGRYGQPGVSQAINTLFHAPAPLGTRLRLVNTSTSAESRFSKCEIWDLQSRRLIATGTQLHMQPSRSSAWLA